MGLERIVSGAAGEACGFSAAQIASPALRELHRYWNRKWRGGRMPRRADIDPLEIPTLLPLVYLVDIERDPLRFRFRLVGTRVVAWLGRDPTGDYLADDHPEGALEPLCRDVLARGGPSFDRLHGSERNGRHGHCQRLLLPLAGEAGGIEMLLGGLHPTPALI